MRGLEPPTDDPTVRERASEGRVFFLASERVFSIARGGRVVVSPCLSLATMSVSIRAVSVSDLLDLSTHFPFSFA